MMKRARAARDRAAGLAEASRRLRTTHRETMSRCLRYRTTKVDSGRGEGHDDVVIARLARIVGRDDAIERAKALVADQYGVTRGQAFELMRQLSQKQNRKVRDIARDVLDGGAWPQHPSSGVAAR